MKNSSKLHAALHIRFHRILHSLLSGFKLRIHHAISQGIGMGLLLLIPITTFAQSPRDIVSSSHKAVKVSSFEAISTLTIRDGKGNERIRKNTMASMLDDDQTEKRIIKFIAPQEVKGTGILIYDHEEKNDDMWIYLPALGKTRRIVSSEKSKAFMGSEFSNADMTAPTLDDFDYELIGSEKLNNVDCWIISSVPKDLDLEDEYGFSKCVNYIIKNNYIVLQTDYYDYDNEKFKTIKTLDYKLLDKSANKYMITNMIAENYQNGRSSVMKMEQIQISATKDEYFTVSYLER